MENKKLNGIYERPLAELVDLFPEEGVCLNSLEDMNPGEEEGL